MPPIQTMRSAASSRRWRIGKLDNTLIIYIEWRQRTSAGRFGCIGTPDDMPRYNGVVIPVAEQLKFYDVWGRPVTNPHMSVAWAWAFDTPFKWTKQVASHFGGTRQGMAMSWPGRINEAGGIRNQFHHMIDIVPTILEAAGIQAPGMVDGIAQKPIEGVSMTYTLDKDNAHAPSTRPRSISKCSAIARSTRTGGLREYTAAAPWLMGLGKMPEVLKGYERELYHIAQDYSEYKDLAASMPHKLQEMQEAFLVEAEKYNVFPLRQFGGGTPIRATAKSQPPGGSVYLQRRDVRHSPAARQTSWTRTYTFAAEVEIPQGGGEGMIVTHGGRSAATGCTSSRASRYSLQSVRPGAVPLGRTDALGARKAHHHVRFHL